MVARSAKGIMLAALAIALIIPALSLAAVTENYCRYGGEEGFVPSLAPKMQSRATHNYDGRIRIYVVEPTSRYISDDLKPYRYGFLDWGYDTTVSLPYMDSITRTIIWNGASVGFGDVQQNNIMVIAVAFNNESHQGYSNPPSGYPFDAYYVDATAAARVDTQWVDTAYGSYTHTSFIEEATATWCPYCPNTRKALDGIYNSHAYPMFFAAMVTDVNSKANNRIGGELNVYGFPTCYFDGGHGVVVGGYLQPGYYTPSLQAALERDVHDLDLSVSLTWLGSAQIQIDLKIKNNEWKNSASDIPSTPTGNDSALVNRNYEFATIAVEPEGDRQYYRFVWQPGDTSEWYGPYDTGDTCKITHAWVTAGICDITAQAMDEYYATGGWSSVKQVVVYSYVAGDADHSGSVNALDVTRIINYLYKNGAAPNPLEAGDTNGNGVTNALDVTYLINYLYKGGPAPKYPAK